MRSSKGFAIIEILLVAAILLALAYYLMKERSQQPAAFGKAMKSAGVEVSEKAKNAEDIEKAVQAQLKASADQREKDLEKSLDETKQ
jgi:hypothetical protein